MGKTFCLSRILILFTMSAIVSAQAIPFLSGEWAPYSGVALPNRGIATEIVSAACKAGGIDFALEFLPWPRVELTLKDGLALGAFPYAINDQRKSQYDFSEPFFYTSPKFLYCSTQRDFAAIQPNGLSELAKYSVVIVAGTWTESKLKAAGMTVYTAYNMDNAVKMLEVGRVDFIVDEPTAIYPSIEKLVPSEIDCFKIIKGDFFGKVSSHLMVSRTYPNSKELLGKFNSGLAAIKANGVIDGIARKYRLTVK